MFIVYILKSEILNRFYTGFTTNLEKRLQFHREAATQKFTGKAADWELFHTIECESKSQALAIEQHIKKMKSKVYILNLKKYPELCRKLLSRYGS